MTTKFENLLDEADAQKISVDENYPFKGDICGLYVDSNIALSDKLSTSVEKACILAEELGHHYTTVGDIVDLSNTDNTKQERKARLWAYNKRIGPTGLIDAYNYGCHESHEIAEYLSVTDEFLAEAVECYKEKYGTFTEYQGYRIKFVPNLTVGKAL